MQRGAFVVRVLVGALAAALLLGCSRTERAETSRVVRIGHFPNVTHVHGLVAHALSLEGKDVFAEHLGPDVRVEYHVFHAGPAAMEALLAGSIDVTYVGPNPAINAYVRTNGTDVRVLSGATRGGSGLVVRKGSGLAAAADFKGKRIATPQLGNTQDVACRAWLTAGGMRVTMTGGDVQVVPTANPDQLALFQSGELDAAWTVEPWISRLELEGGGELLIDEPHAVTTVLVASRPFLVQRGDLAAGIVRGHEALTEFLAADEQRAKRLAAAGFAAITKSSMSPAVLDRCWERLRVDTRIGLPDFESFVAAARAAGLMQETPDLGRLVHSQ